MNRKTLAARVVEDLLERVLAGEFAPGDALPAEAELAREADVSRLTVREALKSLQAQNIVTVRRGMGTYVNPPERWTGMEAVLRAASRGVGIQQVALRLLDVRGMVETGAAEFAARNATDADLSAMDEAIVALERAHAVGDLDAVTLADLAFHDAVFRASANPFVPALLGQLGQLLYATRRETSAFPEVQRHAIEHHKKVRDAIATGDPGTARLAMEAHIRQTYDDYERFIAPEASAPQPRRPERNPTPGEN
ncbi:FadR/GntR family transcriptional regulator [Arthrobacter sp. KK5.5]|uniref:FadR/GntR family transcriptional regulator n=1 Tax=Arthrobacter sp. KK5.5 TaxID=3373084 RepID=UPI003EE52069